MQTSKSFWQSKIFWAAIVTILLGMIPLLADLFKVVIPQSVEMVTAILTFVSGTLTLLWRVFFTDQVIR